MNQSKKHKILLVDDDENLRKMYSEVFVLKGYEVFLASNGKDGLNLALKKNPDIILLDILMPKMDGFSFLENLKKKKPHIPVAVLTNMTNQSDKEEALKLGANDYLMKCDFTPLEVEKKIREYLRN